MMRAPPPTFLQTRALGVCGSVQGLSRMSRTPLDTENAFFWTFEGGEGSKNAVVWGVEDVEGIF
eukprot:COSAG01_NODE_7608_length_3129_cov_1.233333_5_plen_64_part_00